MEMLTLSQDPVLRNVAWHYGPRQIVRMSCSWISSEKPREKSTGRGENWSRDGCSLFLEDVPGSFWFLTLFFDLTSSRDPLIK